ncbi:hypothetical protein D3C72_1438750 [compost metagenome]
MGHHPGASHRTGTGLRGRGICRRQPDQERRRHHPQHPSGLPRLRQQPRFHRRLCIDPTQPELRDDRRGRRPDAARLLVRREPSGRFAGGSGEHRPKSCATGGQPSWCASSTDLRSAGAVFCGTGRWLVRQFPVGDFRWQPVSQIVVPRRHAGPEAVP